MQMSFPENLQRLRKVKKLSQEKLAEIMGVSRQAIAKWECGQSYPDINKLITLRNLFKISIDDLIKDNEKDTCEPKGKVDIKGGLILDKEIIDFLRRAKRATYAGKGAEVISCRPNSHDLEYIEGNLKYYDTYLGGEKFVGEEALWKDNIPFWSMNYIGRVLEEEFLGNFLKDALLLVPEEYPYRGPLKYEKGEYKYICTVEGNCIWFSGHEEIYKNNLKVYECNFHGGLIK
jgi:transcriptional regulator with XRE-family HTH domain